jgi:hypothetical protein
MVVWLGAVIFGPIASFLLLRLSDSKAGVDSMRALILAVLALLLVGCNPQQVLEKLSTPADQALSKGYIADLQAGRLDVIETNLDPSLKTPWVRDSLVRAAELFSEGSPTSVKLVGAQRFISSYGTRTNAIFEYQWGDKWFLESQSKFTLPPKRKSQYAILAVAILAFGLTWFALVECSRMKGIRHKWLWMVFIIFGFGLLSVKWSAGVVGSAGVVSFELLSIGFFSGGASGTVSGTDFGAWTASMSAPAAPVGAIVFLLRRRKLRSALQPTAHVG